MAHWFESRQVRGGSYSAAYVLVFIAILAGVNYLADQYNKTYDATSEKLYSLSDQTVKILGDLDRDVTIYHFDQKSRFREAENSLVRYSNASNRVNVKYIDPDADPALAQAMNVRTYGTTLVEVGANREEAKTTGEEDITNALIKGLKGSDKTACFLTGHGEADPTNSERDGFSIAKNETEGANYKTKTVSLLETPEVPSDCTAVVIAGPTKSYLEQEVAILRDYVKNGGRLLLMIDFQATPELAELAADWGIKVNDDIVIDRSGIGSLFGGGPLSPLIAEYDDTNPITKVMGNVATIFTMTRSVQKAADTQGWDVSELMKTTQGSFATSDFKIENGKIDFKEGADLREGPINVAAAATHAAEKQAEAKPEANAEGAAEGAAAKPVELKEDESTQSRVVVTGTSRFARNAAVGRGGNLDVYLNMLSWLVSDEDLISIRPKNPESTPIDLTSSQIKRIFFGLVIFLPLAIVVMGVRTWWVRR